MKVAVTVALLALGCGSSGTEPLRSSSSTDSGGLPDTGSRLGVVACGGSACAPGEVCALDHDDRAACHSRGEEPTFENGTPSELWPAVLLYCDGDEDCIDGGRCVFSRGEIGRAMCVEETEDCGFHAVHLCTSDDDCHRCQGRSGRCGPERIPSTSLATCGLHR